jgi:hypothetical protein
MKHLEEPIRHLDPDSRAPADLRDMLRSAQQDGPSAQEMARMLSHLAPAAAAPLNSISSSSGGALGSMVKTGILLLVAAMAAVMVKSVTDDRSDSSTNSANPPAPALKQPFEKPKPFFEPQPQLTPDTESDLSMRNQPIRTRELNSPISKKSAKVTRNNKPHQSDANRELALLREARKALPQAASRALTLTEKHRTDYPHGVFEQEREAIAIESLLRIGYKNRAESRAERFYHRFPDSAYRHRIEQLFNREKNFEKKSDYLSPIE